MKQGININIKNITARHHMDMIDIAMKDGGHLDRVSRNYKDFLEGLTSFTMTRVIWGATYEVILSYNPKTDTFTAVCS